MPEVRDVVPQPEAVQLLRRAITASGRSATRYAVEELVRDPRTVRRWLAGDAPIPALVIERCRAQLDRSGASDTAG